MAATATRAQGCLVHVAVGSSVYGGVQSASHLLTRALRHHADLRGHRYRRIELRGGSEWDRGLVAARVSLLAPRGRRIALFFDHIGPSRVQALIPAALRRPHATYLYGIEVWRPLRATALTALRRAKLLLSCSHYTERRARECFPDLPAVSVVPLALAEEPPAGNLDLALLSRLPQTYFLVVGRMHPKERYKGHDLVLEALARLRSRGLAERCVIVGEGSDRARIQGRARDLGLADLVQFVGAVSDVTRDRLYARCRALVLPSTEEGFGLVYLEAMRAGRPCVAARGGAPEEIVRESSTGLLVSPRDPEELSAALARLGRDAGLAEELGKAGRGRWLACYTEDRFRARFYPEIDRLLGDVSS